jgi:hypothetical protein
MSFTKSARAKTVLRQGSPKAAGGVFNKIPFPRLPKELFPREEPAKESS